MVIPALDEAAAIGGLVTALRREFDEVMVVDGGSADGTVEAATAAGAVAMNAPRGRGRQLRVGALAATGEAFWFLHADAWPAPGSARAIAAALEHSEAGVFRVRFAGPSRAARVMTWLYPRLGRVGLVYGDAGLFVRREAYFAAGGFADIELFEDLDLIRRLRRRGALAQSGVEIGVSSRRFEGRLPRTWLLWIALQGLYWMGVSPARLALWYRR